MKFPYRRYDVQDSSDPTAIATIYRPVVPVRVSGSNSATGILGLLDTGADATLLPAFLVKTLGVKIDLDRTARFRGVGNQVVSVAYGNVELEVQRGRQRYRWLATVGFLEGRSVAILGHQAFLEHFKVTFDSERREISLRPNASLSQAVIDSRV